MPGVVELSTARQRLTSLRACCLFDRTDKHRVRLRTKAVLWNSRDGSPSTSGGLYGSLQLRTKAQGHRRAHPIRIDLQSLDLRARRQRLRRLSYLTVLFQDFLSGMQGVTPLACKASQNQSARKTAGPKICDFISMGSGLRSSAEIHRRRNRTARDVDRSQHAAIRSPSALLERRLLRSEPSQSLGVGKRDRP